MGFFHVFLRHELSLITFALHNQRLLWGGKLHFTVYFHATTTDSTEQSVGVKQQVQNRLPTYILHPIGIFDPIHHTPIFDAGNKFEKRHFHPSYAGADGEIL